MAITKTAKVEADIEKIKAKISEFGGKLKELEQKKNEIENSEIVDIVRGMSIPLDELAMLLQSVKDGGRLPSGGPLSALTSGQLRAVDKVPLREKIRGKRTKRQRKSAYGSHPRHFTIGQTNWSFSAS